MDARITIQIVSDRFDEIEQEAERLGRAYLERWGAGVAGRARETAPVDTGYMRDHIGYQVDGSAVEAYSEADYSRHVNFGTVDTPPRPFFTNAAEEGAASAEQLAQDVFRGLGGDGGAL